MLDGLGGQVRRHVVAGDSRWVAAEHMADYEGLGNGDPEAARRVLRRHLAGRGPVTAAEMASRYGLSEADAAEHLILLQATGEVSAGEYRPRGTEREWVDADNLRAIHRETLKLLRADVEPVAPERYAEFLLSWHGIGTQRAARGTAIIDTLERLAGIPIPVGALVPEVLRSRFAGGAAEAVEGLIRSGDYLWQGVPGGRATLLPRVEAGALLRPTDSTGETARSVEEALERIGASFIAEVALATGLPEPEALAALTELVRAGRVTNDALAGMEPPPSGDRWSRRSVRLPRYGRWSILPERDTDPGSRAEAWANRLLATYGVVTREAAVAAEIPVPWSVVADALTTLEVRGEARRGYFVRGLSGVQFAVPGAVERLRRAGRADLRFVPASDPANAYGRLVPLPGAHSLHRVPGNWLVVAGGSPVLAVEGRGRRLVPLSNDRLEEAVTVLLSLAAGLPRGRLIVERWGDLPVTASEGAELLAAAGFSRGPRQMSYRAPVS